MYYNLSITGVEAGHSRCMCSSVLPTFNGHVSSLCSGLVAGLSTCQDLDFRAFNNLFLFYFCLGAKKYKLLKLEPD